MLKFLPYLATSVTSETAIQGSIGLKAAAAFTIGPRGMQVVIGGKAGPKAAFGPVKQPDGREEHQFTATPLGATGFTFFEGTF